MDAKTRAEKIIRDWKLKSLGFTDQVNELAAQISEAERECSKEVSIRMYEKKYLEGYNLAKEQAAKIARDRMDDRDQSIPYDIEQKIRAMTPEGEKK